MEIIQRQIETVLDKLIMAQKIYQRASKRVHFNTMSTLFNDLFYHKKLLVIELATAADIDLNAYDVSLSELIKVEIEKIGMDLDALYIKNNYNEVLSFCIKRERELINAYKDAADAHRYTTKVEALLQEHITQTENVLSRLEERYKSGDFKNWQ